MENNSVKCFGCDSKPMGPVDFVMDILRLERPTPLCGFGYGLPRGVEADAGRRQTKMITRNLSRRLEQLELTVAPVGSDVPAQG